MTPEVIPLWPEGVPGARAGLPPENRDANGWISHVSMPTLTVCRPPPGQANGTAMVLCPGGAYVGLSFRLEGEEFAAWLNAHGVTAFILKYRLQDFGHPAPLQDVLRAVRLVRAQAAARGLRADRVGMIGSSAGGHLAACAGTLFDHPLGRTGAALDAVSARPDWLILMYPVIDLAGPAAHAGSREALLGREPDPAALALLAVADQVSAATPPTLLIHTQADEPVPVENSLRFYAALTRARVPAELLAFERGVHGIGLRGGEGTSLDWSARAADWMRMHGWLGATEDTP